MFVTSNWKVILSTQWSTLVKESFYLMLYKKSTEYNIRAGYVYIANLVILATLLHRIVSMVNYRSITTLLYRGKVVSCLQIYINVITKWFSPLYILVVLTMCIRHSKIKNIFQYINEVTFLIISWDFRYSAGYIGKTRVAHSSTLLLWEDEWSN